MRLSTARLGEEVMMFRMSDTPWRSLYSFDEGSPYVLDAISGPERRLAPEIWIQTATIRCAYSKKKGRIHTRFLSLALCQTLRNSRGASYVI